MSDGSDAQAPKKRPHSLLEDSDGSLSNKRHKSLLDPDVIKRLRSNYRTDFDRLHEVITNYVVTKNPEKFEEVYTGFFKELCQIVLGHTHTNVPVPSPKEWVVAILCCQKDDEYLHMLVDYIIEEDEKLKSNKGPLPEQSLPEDSDDSLPNENPLLEPEVFKQLCSKYQTDFDRLAQLLTSGLAEEHPEKLQEAYAGFFKELCQIVLGHTNVPIPSPEEWALQIFAYQMKKDIKKAQKLIDFIVEEDRRPKSEDLNDVRHATEEAWRTSYVGHTPSLLLHAINLVRHGGNFHKEYGNFFPIIQGSGTGKSRSVDELAGLVFTIPIVLRDPKDRTGYPRTDFINDDGHTVLEQLSVRQTSKVALQRRQLLFLLGCLEFARSWIEDRTHGQDIAFEWKNFLSEPKNRKRLHSFAAGVKTIDLPEIKWGPSDDIGAGVTAHTKRVLDSLKSKDSNQEFILFYFDEAHNLTTKDLTNENDATTPRTAYQCLCKVLGLFKEAELFALFLSTYSKLSEFSPSARNFWSYRGQDADSTDALNPPFVELPFDIWREGSVLVTESAHSLEEICSLKFMARFGRPLFWSMMDHTDEPTVMRVAMEKLTLQREGQMTLRQVFGFDLNDPDLLPILALRVDLSFESNRDEAVFLEGLLVASSMRTVFSVPEHRQYLRGGYPSEPFLAEAASRVLYYHFLDPITKKFKEAGATVKEHLSALELAYKESLPKTISLWLSSGLVSKGERGELVARLLLTLAHDIAVLRRSFSKGSSLPRNISFSDVVPVVDFLSSLISSEFLDLVLDARPQNMQGKSLKEAFKHAYVRFTQFIRGGDNFVVTDEACAAFFFRAAAISGHATLAVMDLIIPVWMWDEYLSRWTMSGIFIQIKNRLRKQPIHIDVEERFDFFSNKDGISDERPYITIAMELGVLRPEMLPKYASAEGTQPSTFQTSKTTSSQPQVQVAVTKKATQPRNAKKGKMNNKHPRYEIKITGCSPSAYNVTGSAVDYHSLLAHTDLFAEHPRKNGYVDAVKQMKPFFERSSFRFMATNAATRIDTTQPLFFDAPQLKEIGKLPVDSVQVRQFGDDAQGESEDDGDEIEDGEVEDDDGQ